MTYDRYRTLEASQDEPLSKTEIVLGWHWCYEWDGMLIGPGMREMEYCLCSGFPEMARRLINLPGRPS